MSASWEPIAIALNIIGRKDLPDHIKNYFTNTPELQAQEHLIFQSIASKFTYNFIMLMHLALT